nr:phospholipase A1-IIdelta [Tanacetum cinerariifolium]
MEGWLTIYKMSDANSPFVQSSAKEQLATHIKALLLKYKEEKISITCTGHSLGASVAVLSAFHIAADVVTPDINVSAMVTGCPQVGDKNFKQWAEQLPDLKVYFDVGVELLIDSRTSPYLKDGTESNAKGPPNYHNSEGSYYHTLCGWNGKNGEFDLNLYKKSVGFVNMFSELLKDEQKIPVNCQRMNFVMYGIVVEFDWSTRDPIIEVLLMRQSNNIINDLAAEALTGSWSRGSVGSDVYSNGAYQR